MKMLDIARGAYSRSPHWVRRYLGPFITLVPTSMRYGATYRTWRNKITKSHIDPVYTEQERLLLLRSLLQTAYDGSSYWRSIFKDTYGTKFDPNTFDFEQLSSLPILTKDVLRENTDNLLAVDHEHVDLVTTGGTSGQPLKFYLDKGRSSIVYAFINENWSKSGYREQDARCVLRGVHMKDVDRKSWEWNSALRELRCSPFVLNATNMDLYFDLVRRYGIQYIHGYPSAIEIMARHMLSSKMKSRKQILGVFPVSEALREEQRQIISQAFPEAMILSNYGMSERVLFAGESVEMPGTFEFEPLFGHLEIIDSHDRVITEPGQRGRIIGTGFVSMGMPLIRYDTEDEGELVSLPSKDNCWCGKVRRITGRWGQEFCVGKDGRKISIAAINVHSENYLAIREFQFYQDEPGIAWIRIVPSTSASIQQVKEYVEEIQKKVGEGLVIKLKVVESIPTTKRGKRPFIEQRLDLGLIENAGF